MTKILDELFSTYSERVPNVRKITSEMVKNGMVKDQNEIINDHVAFRTMGVKNLGINSFEKIVMSKYPSLKETKYWLSAFGSVRMSGTGSTLYIEYDNYEGALEANKEIGRKYKSFMVSSLESYDIFS